MICTVVHSVPLCVEGEVVGKDDAARLWLDSHFGRHMEVHMELLMLRSLSLVKCRANVNKQQPYEGVVVIQVGKS